MPSVKEANNNGLNGINPLAYMGVNPQTPPNLMIKKGAPTNNDFKGIPLGTLWLNVASNYTVPSTAPTTNDLYVLVSAYQGIGTWRAFSSGNLTGIAGDTGGTQMGPVVTFLGGTTGLSFNGVANVETLEFAGITANGGDVNLATEDGLDHAINIGTGNADNTIIIGTALNASRTVLAAGSDGMLLFGTGTVGVTAGIELRTDNSDIQLNPGTGDLFLASNADNSNILIGTGGNTKVITIGNNAAAGTSIALVADAGNITMTGVAGVVIPNATHNYLAIDTATGQIGSDNGPSWLILNSTTVTPATASVVYLTGTLSTDFRNYVILMSNVKPTANANFTLEFSTDNGATYLAANYTTGGNQTTLVTGTVTAGGSVAAANLLLHRNTLASAATIPYYGQLNLYNLNSTTIAPSCSGTFTMTDTGPAVTQGVYTGWHATLAGVNAIRLTMAGTTFASGTFKLYTIA